MENVEEQIVKGISAPTGFKEIVIKLNTLSSGEAGFTTPKISGKIECIIIQKATEFSSIKINAWMVDENIQILDFPQFTETKYLPIRTETVFKSSEEVSENNVAHYYINGPLMFYISGAKNAEVKFIVRYIK